ncbi:MAG: aminopeptidase [Eubacteriaceae bacterium]
MSSNKELEKLLVKRYDNAWTRIDNLEKKYVMEFCERYKKYLDKCKTERECSLFMVEMAKKNGFKSIKDYIKNKEKIKVGDKIYGIFKDKTVVLFKIGKDDLENGMNIIGSHIDCPRLDLKQAPLYQDTELAFFKTHYYGGIKKYQWTTIPLALHGIIVKEDGTKIDISVGENEDEPVFFITDLLPHLSRDQMSKKMNEIFSGEDLNILIGSIPIEDEDEKESNNVKLSILKILNDKYNINEEDFASAELEIVPAGKSRDVGFDKGLIGGYGHDDRVCAFASIEALFNIESTSRTCVAIMADKEEIGSVGNTGMSSKYFENTLNEIIYLLGYKERDIVLRRTLMNSKFLSADVNAALDPNFPNTHDKYNAAYIGKGLLVTKYTGHKGKYSSNDANAEYIAEIRKLLNDNNICWQMGEMGKVDLGGGGTIAYIPAQYGMDVIDVGIALMSMHAPYEIASKVDIYMANRGFEAFYNTSFK